MDEDVRRYGRFVLSGLVAPVATVIATLEIGNAFDVPSIYVLFTLFVVPLLGLGSAYVTGVRTAGLPAPDWLPIGGTRRFRDQIPERHHEAFAVETLNQEQEPENAHLAGVLVHYLVYLAAVPVHAALLIALFSL
ncbi:hypothetical protein [Halomicrobium salinisoli]|uniref:hypothetical protein n=1 Tax=Halomicrobium salinisoli TaxID=2878391 RepID=UPI001CEFE8DC|nr:hypothetical protein [Halomicrobium salinisoli]